MRAVVQTGYGSANERATITANQEGAAMDKSSSKPMQTKRTFLKVGT